MDKNWQARSQWSLAVREELAQRSLSAASVIKEIERTGGKAIAIQADATDSKAEKAAIDKTVAGPEASYVTGANLTVDGGMNA
jgi:hypothetical protein